MLNGIFIPDAAMRAAQPDFRNGVAGAMLALGAV